MLPIQNSAIGSNYIPEHLFALHLMSCNEMRPDFVQIIQQDESRETFKIYSAKLQDQFEAYIKYVCTIVSNNRTKEIKLTYFRRDHVWCVEK